MKQTKFKNNDRVKIVSNDLKPKYKGTIGKAKKVYVSFSDNDMEEHNVFYRVEVDDTVLKRIACDSDLEMA